jgi:hypothetical protein
MYRSTILKPSHYAGQWVIPEKDQHNDLRQVNLLGYAYATSPDGPEKEAKLLHVLELFHGYMMKYLCMIVRGTVPPANTYAGRDSKELLRTLAPRGAEPSKALTDYVCKTLHLAFKQQTTEEIYDTLVFCFMKAARKYDPYYADKTRKVCEVISELPAQEFSREQLEARVGFDCIGILRSLVSKGFLTSHIVKKKVMGWSRGPHWPAPASYFQSGPIGFVYMLQQWFRYYFKEDISLPFRQMRPVALLVISIFVRIRNHLVQWDLLPVSVGFTAAISYPHLESSLPLLLVSSPPTPNQVDCRLIDHCCRSPTQSAYPLVEAPQPERTSRLNNKELNAAIEKIDRAMALLDDQRSALVCRLIDLSSHDPSAPKILHFPSRVWVRRPSRESAEEGPPGSGARCLTWNKPQRRV